jgi:UDP-N-acetylglucosamine 2-epimerase (non-hydrolysing)
MAALDAAVDHIVIHTSQNWDFELRDIFFTEMGIRKPNYTLDTRGNTPIEMTADIMVKLEPLLIQLKPDAILILGDTNGCVATAYVAKRHKIPLMHMEAGNRCFDDRTPEEVNRRIVDQLSDINMPYSSIARENLLHDGLPSDRIIKTGSPQNEILSFYGDQIRASKVLSQLNLTLKEYFLVSVHREENCTEEKFAEFVDMLGNLAHRYRQRIVVSVHPRLRKLIEASGIGLDSSIELHRPFGFFNYNKLQLDARCVLSVSGTITEESVLQGFPALNLRETHERPEGMEEAVVIMTSFANAVDRILDAEAVQPFVPVDWQCTNVSEKVVRIILSYVDYVNRVVWRKQ